MITHSSNENEKNKATLSDNNYKLSTGVDQQYI